MPSGQHPHASTRVLWILPLAALLAIVPLILHGCSCGQDLAFHIQSWLDAAQQLRHGHYPHWAFTAAWNAGEPRFLFYPPLSWLLGAILTLVFPIAAATPTIYIFIALLASGLTFYKLARYFASSNAALIASALYLANPYMLFCAFERSALAELLAAAWIPLLLLAILRPRPTIRGIAIPIALLWLTNAPAAVIGSYALALLATFRVVHAIFTTSKLSSRPEAGGRSGETRSSFAARTMPGALRLTLTCIAGTLLGLALPAFYLIPAAYERRFIQVAMAIIPNLRYQDNFLFTRTADAAHNAVNHTASTLALTLLILTAAILITLFLSGRKPSPSQLEQSPISEAPPASLVVIPHEDLLLSRTPVPLAPILALLTAIITFLLTPLSAPVWRYLPELAFLQFPWRLLILLAPILALAIALLLDHFNVDHLNVDRPNIMGAPSMTQPHRGMGGIATLLAALILPLALGLYTFNIYAQSCDPTNDPATIAHNLATHHGFAPTDEYTPTNADNDLLRSDNPGYWLIPQGTNANTPAPNTLPTASKLNPRIDTDDTPIPLAQTLSTPAPHHLTLTTDKPAILVLNLRDYPNWDITETDPNFLSLDHPMHLQRNDGLIAIPLYYASNYIINITWRHTPDQTLGLLLSVLALFALAFPTSNPARLNSRRPRRTA